jgi:glycosyltransferase involved in cell wall biosynthesis
LIDDGSKDGSADVCREYAAKDSRIRYVRHDDNSGLPAKRYNEGMMMATADYFMFMFDDDFWYKHAIEDLYAEITGEHKNCGMVYGLTKICEGDHWYLIGGEWNLEYLAHDNLLANLSVIVKREAINAVGGYDDDPVFRRVCDWDLWVRISRVMPVSRVAHIVGEITTQPDGLEQTVPLDFRAVMNLQRRPSRVLPLKGMMVKE